MIEIDGWRVHEGNNFQVHPPPSPSPIRSTIGLVSVSEYFLLQAKFLPPVNRLSQYSGGAIGPEGGSVTLYTMARIVLPQTPK
jgi:hypothetical protein